jgi:hypothetical protein
MSLETTRVSLDAIISTIPDFKKSTRGLWLYKATTTSGSILKVQFAGNNFKVHAVNGDTEIPIKSIPLSKLRIEKVMTYLEYRLRL